MKAKALMTIMDSPDDAWQSQMHAWFHATGTRAMDGDGLAECCFHLKDNYADASALREMAQSLLRLSLIPNSEPTRIQ